LVGKLFTIWTCLFAGIYGISLRRFKEPCELMQTFLGARVYIYPLLVSLLWTFGLNVEDLLGARAPPIILFVLPLLFLENAISRHMSKDA